MTMVQEELVVEEEKGKRERKVSTRSRLSRESTRTRGRERDEDRHEDRHRSKDRDKDRHREKRRSRDRDHDERHREHDKRRSRSYDNERDDKKLNPVTPEFLHALAHSPTKSEFDVITGADAVRFTRKFVRDQGADALPPPLAAAAAPSYTPSAVSHTSHKSHASHKSLTDNEHDPKAIDAKLKRSMQPVVFAFPRTAAGDAGRRVVDFYMSWRGKTKTTPLKGRSRRAGFLDAEFRRVREVLDGEWKRASRALKGAVRAGDGDEIAPGPVQLVRAPTDPQPLPRLPPMLTQFAHEEHDKAKDGPSGHTAPPAARSVSDPLPGPSYPLPSSFPINTERPMLGTHRGSVDSLTSVTSLPLLGMVRGVPFGNRVPLRVTNPGDRMSISSSSGSIAPIQPIQPIKSSPLRDGVSFNEPASKQVLAANEGVAGTQPPGRTVSESSASSGGSSKSKKSKSSRRSSEKEKEKTPHVEDDDRILIVLLDENDKNKKKLVATDKGNKTNRDNKDNDDNATWHRLEDRLPSALRPLSLGPTHDSPWLGPLTDLDEDVTYITPDHSDCDSDSDEDEGDVQPHFGAAVPLKDTLSSLGFLAPEAAVLAPTPSPHESYAALPPAYSSLYGKYSSPYATPQLQGSPYQLPPSRPRTPVSYGTTPPMAPPLWTSPSAPYPPSIYASPAPAAYWGTPAMAQSPLSSPVAAYPPTAYTSPAPAGYATAPSMGHSPWPSPGTVYPATAYTSPAPVGLVSPYPPASPALSTYANLAAGYSSPYVPPLQSERHSPGFQYC